jgi:hypothetical protein
MDWLIWKLEWYTWYHLIFFYISEPKIMLAFCDALYLQFDGAVLLLWVLFAVDIMLPSLTRPCAVQGHVLNDDAKWKARSGGDEMSSNVRKVYPGSVIL